jgi:hypothetical protein
MQNAAIYAANINALRLWEDRRSANILADPGEKFAAIIKPISPMPEINERIER